MDNIQIKFDKTIGELVPYFNGEPIPNVTNVVIESRVHDLVRITIHTVISDNEEGLDELKQMVFEVKQITI